MSKDLIIENKPKKISMEITEVLKNNYNTHPISTIDFLEFIGIIQNWCECNLNILQMREDIKNSICHDCIHDQTDPTGAWLCEYGLLNQFKSKCDRFEMSG